MGRKGINPKRKKSIPQKRKKSEACRHMPPKLNTCMKHFFKKEEINLFQQNLLKWYDCHQRKLPWREIAKNETDPDKRGYAVWVSEVMLQQTQVATVISYFLKWMEKWPNVNALSTASLEEVNEVWAGLGYYSRARRLHEGSRIISKNFHSKMPQTVHELTNLIPGIGQYTAAAIASIAYQQVVGVVDGNVSRVLSRIRVIGSCIAKPSTRNALWQLADSLASTERPGDFNQALMELGATVCAPRNPQCDKCPVSDHCTAYALAKKGQETLAIKERIKIKQKRTKVVECNEKNQLEVLDIESVPDCPLCLPAELSKSSSEVTIYPCKAKKKVPRKDRIGVVVIETCGDKQPDNCMLMIQRPDSGLLAGLWEFPSIPLSDTISVKQLATCVEDKLSEFGIKPVVSKHRKLVGEVVHIFSHIHTTYVVEHLNMEKPDKNLIDKKYKSRWLTREEITLGAVSTAMKKVLKLVDSQKTIDNKKLASRKRKRNQLDPKAQLSITSYFS